MHLDPLNGHINSGEQPPFCLFRTSMYPTFPSGRQKPPYSGLVGFSEKPLFWPLVEPKASSAYILYASVSLAMVWPQKPLRAWKWAHPGCVW